MVSAVLRKAIQEIRQQLIRDLRREWVFPAAARYGELVEAFKLQVERKPSLDEFQSQVRNLINVKQEVLVSSWESECKHMMQMVASGYALIYEELLALLTGLSELAFVKT
jgi:hypothetical protein